MFGGSTQKAQSRTQQAQKMSSFLAFMCFFESSFVPFVDRPLFVGITPVREIQDCVHTRDTLI
jgi:hypothetical protein